MATAEGRTIRDRLTLTSALYRQNAFRVLGLPVTASAREVARENDKLKMAAHLGAAQPKTPAAFSIIPPPDATAARESARRLNDPAFRSLDEFFWFWPLSWGESRDAGLEAIAAGRGELAEAAWRKQAREPHAIHNLAVLDHLRALDLEASGRTVTLAPDAQNRLETRWRSALDHWYTFDTAATAHVWGAFERHLSETVGDRLPTDLLNELRSGLGTALLSINARMAADALQTKASRAASLHLQLLSAQQWGQQASAEAGESAAQTILGRVHTLCDQHEAAETSDVRKALRGVVSLLDQTEPALTGLAGLLPPNSPSLISAADRVGKVVRPDMIRVANETKQWSAIEPVLRRLRRLVRGAAARELMTTDLSTVVENRIGDEAGRIASSSVDDRTKVMSLRALATSLTEAQKADPVPPQTLGEALDAIAAKMNDIAFACFKAKRYDIATEALVAGEATCADAGMRAKFAEGKAAVKSHRDAQQGRQLQALIWGAVIVIGILSSVFGSGKKSSSPSRASTPPRTLPWTLPTPAPPAGPKRATASAPREVTQSGSARSARVTAPSVVDDGVETGGLGNGQKGRVSKGDMPRFNELNRQILADRGVILQYKRQLKVIRAEMDQAEREIDMHKNAMESMKKKAQRGLEVNEYLYETHRNQHNSAVERYNAALERQRPLARELDAVIDAMNVKIDEHNGYIHLNN